MKKICLISTPSPFLLDERVFPFLGILKVASAWREQGADVDFLDLSGLENCDEVITEYLSRVEDLEFIGITATTPQMPIAFKIGELIKSVNPNMKLVIGGSHVTLMHTAAKKGSDRAKPEIEKILNVFDVLVAGDGELTLRPILELKKGVIDVDDKKSPYFLSNQDFSELPFPARDLIDLSSYKYTIEGENATSLIAQLGCPYRCISAEEKVYVKNVGWIEIGKIATTKSGEAKELFGVEVMTEDGSFREASHLLNQGIQPCMKIDFEDNSKSLIAHPDHRIKSKKENGDDFIEVRNLKSGDMVLLFDSENNNKFYTKVKNIEDVQSRELFDLTVPNVENYVSFGGIINHNCSFCSGRSSPYLRLIRNRSTESVIEELEFLHKTYGYKGFMLYDDELNVNKNMIQLMEEIKKLADKYNTKFKLRGFTKSELFTEEQAEAMKMAGFTWLLGFESGDPRVLETIDKNATVEDNTRCVSIAKKYGLKVKALMSIGHAGESLNSINNTKNWLLDVNPDDFDCTVITTYPGSPYFDKAVREQDCWVYTSPKNGDKLYQKSLDYTKEADYYKGVPGNYISFVWTDFLSAKELAEQRDLLESDVRKKLGIPFNPSAQAKRYEHSMGQGNSELPDWILRSGKAKDFKKLKSKLRVTE